MEYLKKALINRARCIAPLLFLLTSSVLAQDATPVTTHDAPPDGSKYTWTEVASDFDSPIYITNAGDGSGRMFIVEQLGVIFVMQKDGTVNDDPFLDISELLPRKVFSGEYTEQGLLGLAFAPDYAQSGRFFIDYTDNDGNTVVARYQVDPDNPDLADSFSPKIILTVDQPFEDHNGGNIVFGPDGYLYVGLGDGGHLNDSLGNGQNKATMLSKILRIDVSGDSYTIPATNPYIGDVNFAPETWVWGVRNPWRFTFDRATGDMYIGDVGQASWEEVDFLPAGDKGGENFGWSAYEGTHTFVSEATPPFTPAPMPDASTITFPVTEFDHSVACSVTGGYVYRGQALPELQGYYFYGDYCYGRIWTLYRDSAGNWQGNNLFTDTGRQISSFGQDEQGELYFVDYKGPIFRLDRAP
jgi:glucose/arabinose dehydrogenase